MENNQEITTSSSVSGTGLGSFVFSIWKWTSGWLSWSRHSETMLRNVEQKILSSIKTAYNRFYVDIGSVVGQCDKIWTITLNDKHKSTPLVMLHGMASGVALWCPNLDAFAATRPVYAIDLLGFGRSSRPTFSSDPDKVEAQWVESIEEWRREVKLNEFILLGHSLGGYLATAYALKYPERVRHLILADPWGFADEKDEKAMEKIDTIKIPLYVRIVGTALRPFNPLSAVRAAGPAGRWLVTKSRPDIPKKYKPYLPDAETLIPEYIYQCNSQTPSGESAFNTLMTGWGWAKNPMIQRAGQLDPALPVTMLYGARSWINDKTGHLMSERRQTKNTYVQVINGAGHHVYLDKPDVFNKFVLEACARADSEPRTPITPTTTPTATPAAPQIYPDNETDDRGGQAVGS